MNAVTVAPTMPKPAIMTVQQHILREQRRHSPHATGSFSWLLSGITLHKRGNLHFGTAFSLRGVWITIIDA